VRGRGFQSDCNSQKVRAGSRVRPLVHAAVVALWYDGAGFSYAPRVMRMAFRRSWPRLLALVLFVPVAWACDGAGPESRPSEPAVVAKALRLPKVFGDAMVLQRDLPLPVWGWAQPGASVRVRFADQSHTTRVGEDGRWRLQLDPMPASSEPREFSVVSEGAGPGRTFENVLVGDVYLASGQSNMAIGLEASQAGSEALQRANHPTLRFFRVSLATSPAAAAEDVAGKWVACSPQTAASVSAVAYYFGRKLVAELGLPVGIVQAAQGNTWAESWIPREALAETPAGRAYVDAWEAAQARFEPKQALARDLRRSEAYRKRAAEALAAGRQLNSFRLRKPHPTVAPRLNRGWPGTLYNGMIAPLEPFGLRGVIWYQGERNARVRGYAYRSVLPTLIEHWRRGFENSELAFYIVQLEDWLRPEPEPRESAIAEIRESQLRVHRDDPRSGLAVIIDTAERGAIHPKNKQLPGERLALWALAREPGFAIEPSGPQFESQRVEGDRIVLSFSHIGAGLMVGRRNGAVEVTAAQEPLASFAIAGEDGNFVWAEAKIRGDEVVVRSDAVSMPVAVRYAWADNPAGSNLYNRVGLPASPFRTDSFPVSTQERLEPRLPSGYREKGSLEPDDGDELP
jgi:sialate O-acetylesterase